MEELPYYNNSSHVKIKKKCDESYFVGSIVSTPQKVKKNNSYSTKNTFLCVKDNLQRLEPKIGSGWKQKQQENPQKLHIKPQYTEKLDLTEILEKNKNMSLFQEENSSLNMFMAGKIPVERKFMVFDLKEPATKQSKVNIMPKSNTSGFVSDNTSTCNHTRIGEFHDDFDNIEQFEGQIEKYVDTNFEVIQEIQEEKPNQEEFEKDVEQFHFSDSKSQNFETYSCQNNFENSDDDSQPLFVEKYSFSFGN